MARLCLIGTVLQHKIQLFNLVVRVENNEPDGVWLEILTSDRPDYPQGEIIKFTRGYVEKALVPVSEGLWERLYGR